MKPGAYQFLACVAIAFGAYASLGTSCLGAEAAAELPAQTLTVTSQSPVSQTFQAKSNGWVSIDVEFAIQAPEGTQVLVEWTTDEAFSQTNFGSLSLTSGSALPVRRKLCQRCNRVTLVATSMGAGADVSLKPFAHADAGCSPDDPIFLTLEVEE